MRRVGPGVILSYANWIARKHLLRQAGFLRPVNGHLMYLDLRVAGISKVLALYGTREEDLTEIIRTEMKPASVHLDVGANIGYYALLAARIVGKSGKVHCLEPDPRNIEILRRNVKLNGLEDVVEITEAAASRVSGQGEMLQTRASNLNTLAIGACGVRRGIGARSITVRTIAIDDYMESRGGKFDTVRMDIEGYEVEAIDGMVQTLDRSLAGCRLFIETHPQAYHSERDFGRSLELLDSLGFVPKVLVSAGEAEPQAFTMLGYRPSKVMIAGAFNRGYYENVRLSHAIDLCCRIPKVVRYIVLEKTKV